MEISEKHPSLASIPEVKQLIKPLEKLGIDGFNFIHVYPNHTFTILLTNGPWHKYFLKKESSGSFPLDNVGTGIYLWQDLINPQMVTDARNHFSIDNIITFAYKHINHLELAIFTTPPANNSAISFYYNNLDLLHTFVKYFKEKASALFQQANKSPIFFPENMWKPINNRKFIISAQNRAEFYKSIGVVNKYLNFSKKEAEILRYLTIGKSVKEIAAILNNSSRTIETHIANVKIKTNSVNKSHLINTYIKQSAIPFYLDLLRIV